MLRNLTALLALAAIAAMAAAAEKDEPKVTDVPEAVVKKFKLDTAVDKKHADYQAAMDRGLWKGTYVATDPAEYWAEGAQAYFDCMRPQFGANTREKLEKYDAGLFKLVDEVYRQSKFRYVRYDQRKPGTRP